MRIKEKEITNRVADYFNKENNGRYTMWVAPKYKLLSWDIFNCFDLIIAFHDDRSPFYIQATTLTNLSHRRKKIMDFFHSTQAHIPNCYIFAWDAKKEVFKIEKLS